MKKNLNVEDNFDIAVIGYGRFGSLWVKLLCDAGRNVAVYDKRYTKKESITESHKKNDLDDSRAVLIEAEELSRAQIIFFCVPISHFRDSLYEMREYIAPNTIICDTCSVKEKPIEWMSSILASGNSILGLHPLFGPDSVASEQYRSVVLCRHRSEEATLRSISTLLISMGMNIIEMTAEDHDRQSLYSQGLTHFLGRILEKLELQKREVSTKGFESLLEIIEQTCRDSTELFFDLQNYNKGSRLMWDDLKKALDSTVEDIESHNNPN